MQSVAVRWEVSNRRSLVSLLRNFQLGRLYVMSWRKYIALSSILIIFDTPKYLNKYLNKFATKLPRIVLMFLLVLQPARSAPLAVPKFTFTAATGNSKQTGTHYPFCTYIGWYPQKCHFLIRIAPYSTHVFVWCLYLLILTHNKKLYTKRKLFIY